MAVLAGLAFLAAAALYIQRPQDEAPPIPAADPTREVDSTRALRRLLNQGYQLEAALQGAAQPRPQIGNDPVYLWARAAWQALRDDYPVEAKEFYGHDAIIYSPGYFMTTYSILASQDRLAYLRPRLRILERVVGVQQDVRHRPITGITDAAEHAWPPSGEDTSGRLVRDMADKATNEVGAANATNATETERLLETLGDLYSEGSDARAELVNASAVGIQSMLDNVAQLPREQAARDWDRKVRGALKTQPRFLPGWDAAEGIREHPDPYLALIQPVTSKQAVLKFYDAKLGALRMIMERLETAN